MYSNICKETKCCDCCRRFLGISESVLGYLTRNPDDGLKVFEYLKKRVKHYASISEVSGFWEPWCLDELNKCISCLDKPESLLSHFSQFIFLWQDKPGEPEDKRLSFCPFINFEKLWGCVLHPDAELLETKEDFRGITCINFICE